MVVATAEASTAIAAVILQAASTEAESEPRVEKASTAVVAVASTEAAVVVVSTAEVEAVTANPLHTQSSKKAGIVSQQ
jgi:hypothetical protein